ncbi:MAG: DUF1244 domain-containing protein [Pseudomonadota bacterium]|nr:DUF1244 domain-containing protein [Pseudomonadota bacterium]
MTDPSDSIRTEIEAATLRRLLTHLDENRDVQNIDLMILAGFCRNCLSKWYREAAENNGVNLSEDEARETVYRMPYDRWKSEFQAQATPEQIAQLEARQSD